MLRISNWHYSSVTITFAKSKSIVSQEVKGFSKNLLISICLHDFCDEMLILLWNASTVGFLLLLLLTHISSFHTFLFSYNLGMEMHRERSYNNI